LKDIELNQFQNRIGKKKYVELYHKYYSGCKVKKNKRFSGEVYENDDNKINEIKQKYSKGVTKEIISDWIKNL